MHEEPGCSSFSSSGFPTSQNFSHWYRITVLDPHSPSSLTLLCNPSDQGWQSPGDRLQTEETDHISDNYNGAALCDADVMLTWCHSIACGTSLLGTTLPVWLQDGACNQRSWRWSYSQQEVGGSQQGRGSWQLPGECHSPRSVGHGPSMWKLLKLL